MPKVNPGAIIRVLRYPLVANATFDLVMKVVKFVYGDEGKSGQHSLTHSELQHIEQGGTIIFEDADGNEICRHG